MGPRTSSQPRSTRCHGPHTGPAGLPAHDYCFGSRAERVGARRGLPGRRRTESAALRTEPASAGWPPGPNQVSTIGRSSINPNSAIGCFADTSIASSMSAHSSTLKPEAGAGHRELVAPTSCGPPFPHGARAVPAHDDDAEVWSARSSTSRYSSGPMTRLATLAFANDAGGSPGDHPIWMMLGRRRVVTVESRTVVRDLLPSEDM